MVGVIDRAGLNAPQVCRSRSGESLKKQTVTLDERRQSALAIRRRGGQVTGERSVDDTVQDELSREEFRTIRIAGIDLSARSYLLYAKEKPLSKAAEAFLDALRTRRLNP